MFNIEEEDKKIIFRISSEMKLVDRVVRQSREFISQFELSEFSSIKLALREMLINAVEHGNKNINSKTVTCSIERLPEDRYMIYVEDEGEGFDHENIDLAIPDDAASLRSRGLPLINTLTDGMIFNEAGNAITAYITLEKQTNFEFSQDDEGEKVITPSGDITAATAENLKQKLKILIDEGCTDFCFDFSNVKDVDSVGLSTLIVLSRTMENKGVEFNLEVINASSDIVRLFEMTHLDDLYKINTDNQ